MSQTYSRFFSEIAIAKPYQEHQDALLNLGERYEKLRYSLQNCADILQAHRRLAKLDTRGGGNQFAGLTHIKGIDLDYLAYQLAQNDYGGKKATSQAFRMAEQACALLKKVDLEYAQKWYFGRMSLSAFTLVGIYHLKRVDDRGDGPCHALEMVDPRANRGYTNSEKQQAHPPPINVRTRYVQRPCG